MQETQVYLNLVDRFPQANVLVVGDMMLDRFLWGKVSRISPEAPVPVVQVVRETALLGGAANVVCNIQALGGKTEPLGMVGKDGTASDIRAMLEEKGISCRGLMVGDGFCTIQKTRIVAHHQQVCRVDREGEPELSTEQRGQIEAQLLKMLPDVQAVIVSDYGKGVIHSELLQCLMHNRRDIYVSVDPKDKNFDHYQMVDVVTPNHSEAERMSGITIKDRPSLLAAAQAIFTRIQCRHLLITLGEHGMALFTSPTDLVRIPTRAREVFDVSGAGDTVIATYTLAKAVRATPSQAAWLANLAAGIVVGKLGTATVTADELKKAVNQPQVHEPETTERFD